MIETKELGYLILDNRVSGGKLFEASTYTCTHCNSVVVLNPERQRERMKCVACSHQICDNCGAAYSQTRECLSLKRRADELLESAARQVQAGGSSLILLP